MLREPVRDKRYRETCLGPSVTDYLGWKENEARAAPRTLDHYERDLARMCMTLAAHGLHEVTTDDLRAVRDSFPKGSRKRVTAAMKDFWRWLYDEGRIDRDPMARVRYPKRESQAVLDVFTPEEEARLVTAQGAIRDRLGVLLLLDSGIRASEIRSLRVEDVDMVERWIIVRRGKGGKGRVVPVRGRVVLALEEFMLTPIPKHGRSPEAKDFILYPTGASGSGPTWADRHGRWLIRPSGAGGIAAVRAPGSAIGSRTRRITPTRRSSSERQAISPRHRKHSVTRRSVRRSTFTRTFRWPTSRGPSRRWKRPAKRIR